MNVGFISSWLTHPLEQLRSLTDLLEERQLSDLLIKDFSNGSTILNEGRHNPHLYVLLKGTVELVKSDKDDQPVRIDWLRPGAIVGILSFCSGRPALTSAICRSDSKFLCISEHQLEELTSGDTELNDRLQQLFMSNLIERYQHVVSVHMQLDETNRAVASERNQLQEALQKLEASQQRLISQEKMATLGQLVAGIAHELNNPTAALARSSQFLKETLPNLISDPQKEKVVREGINASIISTSDQRTRLRQLQKELPNIERPLLRKLAGLNPEFLLRLIQDRTSKKWTARDWTLIAQAYEAGTALKNVSVSANRVEKLVSGLKQYSRQGSSYYENADLREGIKDTLLILNNRLKKRQLELELEELPTIRAMVGELNQVWTNLLINSCDATNDGDKIKVSCKEEFGVIQISVEDEGPGVPDEIKERIFESSFTTKTESGNFGLGLGLAISKQIILKHGGDITLEKSELGGARFVVVLPV